MNIKMRLRIVKMMGVILLLALMVTPVTIFAKANPQLSMTTATVSVGKSFSLKVKNNKKKIIWTSKDKKVAAVTQKGKVTGRKAGTTYIFAKIKDGKKLKCKVVVKSQNADNNSDSVGTNSNPANVRNGVTVSTENGTMYFKLLSSVRGETAINQLKSMGEWGSYQEEQLQEYPNTTLTLLIFDVQALSGYSAYPLTGLDIINPYGLYDGNCSSNINHIVQLYMNNDYESKDSVNLTLYSGSGSKMYTALFIPNGMTSFSNTVFAKGFKPYWVRYIF